MNLSMKTWYVKELGNFDDGQDDKLIGYSFTLKLTIFIC